MNQGNSSSSADNFKGVVMNYSAFAKVRDSGHEKKLNSVGFKETSIDKRDKTRT